MGAASLSSRNPSCKMETVAQLLRGLGWTLVSLGAVILLYVVYQLWFTNFESSREQAALADQWQQLPAGSVEIDMTDAAPDTPAPDLSTPDISDGPEFPEDGQVYAVMWFERDGRRVVADDLLYVVDSVSDSALRRGPGHYPESAAPGEDGNLAIAGHRTTYGSPFWAVDELVAGDTIHVIDRSGREWVYAVHSQLIVEPRDLWVVSDDPLGTGVPTITLTTCHPRLSDAQRLIVWGELIGVEA